MSTKRLRAGALTGSGIVESNRARRVPYRHPRRPRVNRRGGRLPRADEVIHCVLASQQYPEALEQLRTIAVVAR